MSRTLLLPPTLLDFTLARAAGLRNISVTRPVSRKCLISQRYMHEAVLAADPGPPGVEHLAAPREYSRSSRLRRRQNYLTARTRDTSLARPMTELDRRVQALQETVVSEASFLGLPQFSDEDLMLIYKDLLALPDTPAEPSVYARQISSDNDLLVIKSVDERLHAETSASSHEQPRRRILSRVQAILARIENVRSTVLPVIPTDGKASVDPSPLTKAAVAVPLLSTSEWDTLIRISVQAQDGEAAELSLDLMKRAGFDTAEGSLTHVLEFFADRADTDRMDRVMSKLLTGLPTERQRDIHVKAHIKANPVNTIPTTALSVLHAYELRSLPAPMTTYTRVITSLFNAHSSLAHAQAWDLFSHMRYVAHPHPDLLLYTLMIRACAASRTARSEPERALDLWTEMTTVNRISPNAGAYGAVILACARSGEKTYVSEAFRFAKEMLDTHRDASGNSLFGPDQRTFCALLEGAKRMGDLGRMRWILAEMVKCCGEVEGVKVNEEVIMHMFHGYATYRPPFKRSAAILVEEEKRLAEPQDQGDQPDPTLPSSNLPVEDIEPSFSHIPPQSRPEVVAEAKALFARIVEGLTSTQSRSTRTADKKFGQAKLTTRLLNSYLSVHYAHSSLQTARDLFNTLFAELGVSRNACSFVDALERCAGSQRGSERSVGLAFAEDLWNEWKVVEDGWKDGGVDARMVERANAAMIRVLALTDHVDRALDLLKSFVERYPPSTIRVPTPKPAFQSTRTVLVGARPLVRLKSWAEIPDDNVPPLLTFGDVEILHHRLVADGRKGAEIGYVKYVCKAYEGALRVRRDGRMRAEPLSVGGGRMP